MKIGYLPEESYIYPYLTARETLEFYSNLFPMQPQERKARVTELLEMVGLTQAGNRQVGEFSKGMARRVGLAQALINDPELVILDEPTSGLDPIGCRQVKDLILMLAERGKTVLLCSHLLADVEDVCNRIAILYNGTIRAMGDMHNLLEEKSRHRFTVEEMPPGAMEPILSAFRSALGSEPHVDHPRRDLEQYFLNVVEQARRDGTEATGADHGGTQPEFLDASGPGLEQESR